MSQLKKSAKSVGTIVILSLGSKVLGFFREALIASRYGSGSGTDTFFIALSAVTLFSALLIQTINTTLIPVLSDVEVHDGKEGKMNYFNNFLNIITLTSILIAVFAFFTTPFIIKVIGRGFEGNQFDYAILLTRLGLPILIISGIVGSLRGYLQSEERFAESAIAAYPFNLVYILFLLFFAENFSITALMVVAVVAEASKLLIPIPSLKDLGYRYNFVINLKDKYIKQMAMLIPPVLLSVGISDLYSVVDKSMASSLAEGSVSSLNYANTLKNIVHSVFITAIITVVFPILSKEANARNYTRLKKIMQTSLNIVLLILIPTTVGMIILAEPAVKFAYQRGQFGDTAALMTTTALIAYSIGLIGAGVQAILIRIFYALQDTKMPMINSFYGLVLNVIFNLIFVQFFDHNGLALATSLSTTLTAILLLYELRKKIGNLGLEAMIQSSLKTSAASVIMGIVIYFMYNYSMQAFNPSRLMELMLVIVTVLIGFIIYLVFLYLFKVDELHFVTDHVKKSLENRK